MPPACRAGWLPGLPSGHPVRHPAQLQLRGPADAGAPQQFRSGAVQAAADLFLSSPPFLPTRTCPQVARACIGLVITASYPVIHFPARAAARDLLQHASGRCLAGRVFEAAESLVFFSGTAAIALWSRDLGEGWRRTPLVDCLLTELPLPNLAGCLRPHQTIRLLPAGHTPPLQAQCSSLLAARAAASSSSACPAPA